MPLSIHRREANQECNQPHYLVETAIGRTTWLSHIKRMVTQNIDVLYQHKWHIIDSSPDMQFPTSDNPVICLAFRDFHNYRLDGGWKQKNAEILFPLTPKKLLYTKVGSRQSVERYSENKDFTQQVNFFILQTLFWKYIALSHCPNYICGKTVTY